MRWIACRGHGDDTGTDDRTKFGVFLDATARKNAEEANELLAGEMSHRDQEPFGHRRGTHGDHGALVRDDG